MISLILSFHLLYGHFLMHTLINRMAKDMPKTHIVDDIK